MNQSQNEKVEQIYKRYYSTLNPLIQAYEVLAREFPIEIMNEIRAIFTHLARCYGRPCTDQEIDENIVKAERHMHRAVLDGFKYNCFAIQDWITKFKIDYAGVLEYVDNGKFLGEFVSSELTAQDLFLAAKTQEANGEDDDVFYDAYEAAYNEYFSIYQSTREKTKEIQNIKERHDKNYRKKFIISLIFNGFMAICTVASVIFGLISIL